MKTFNIVILVIQALGSLAVAVSLIWLWIQAMTTKKQFLKQVKDKERDIDYEKKKCACDMARYFAEEIVPITSCIKSVMTTTNVASFKALFEIFPSNKVKRFDVWEMNELLTASEYDVEYVIKALYDVEPISVYDAKIIISESASERSAIQEFYSDIKNNEDKAELLLGEYSDSHTVLLNKLEWFAMIFQYGIADEETVYQSLHQVFLSSVNLMYYSIASLNQYIPDKYYTNIIWLYNHWEEKLRADEEGKLTVLARV